ncbi:glycine betaine ABC transporter substrate-binding protein [Piscibacillus halophilus]|uniref:Glycine betaine/proline transport system substrate-binding protein n=1 Tax=Piscibacillus halophilus TaxID=571933 RepID=A0A1H9HW12_9BACI|nr:glycine betaine ABC transporter substrate-binding protein [Piscibacillus halophilus]SEQ66457.1 glycine betaine/proline transport system substrate-binding protein [Piscibacillus halophilus]
MKKFLITLMMVSLIVLAACGSSDEAEGSEEGGEDKGTISFAVTPWTSTVPPTKVAKIILEDMGYEVEETQADVSSTFVGLSRGDLDVFMDSWMPAHELQFEEYEDSIEMVATSYEDADSGLVIPTYVEGIEKVSDLKGREDEFNNKIYGIEEGASATEMMRDLIEEADLDLELITSSEGGMLAQAQKEMNSDNPVIFYGWRPHTMFNKYDIEVIEDDYGYFETSSVHVLANNGLKDKAPDAYEFLQNWSIPLEDVEEMIVKIEDGQDEEEVAQEWIDEHQDQVDNMLNN